MDARLSRPSIGARGSADRTERKLPAAEADAELVCGLGAEPPGVPVRRPRGGARGAAGRRSSPPHGTRRRSSVLDTGMVVFAVNPRQSAEVLLPTRGTRTTSGTPGCGHRGAAPGGVPAAGAAAGIGPAAAGADPGGGPAAPGAGPAMPADRSALVDYFPQLLEVAGGELWERAPRRRGRARCAPALWGEPDRCRRDSRLWWWRPLHEPAIRTALVHGRHPGRAGTGLLDGPEAGGPDLVSVLRSRPGAGDQALARLFAWGFEALREGNYRRLRAYCGVAPIRTSPASPSASSGGARFPVRCNTPATSWREGSAAGMRRWRPTTGS